MTGMDPKLVRGLVVSQAAAARNLAALASASKPPPPAPAGPSVPAEGTLIPAPTTLEEARMRAIDALETIRKEDRRAADASNRAGQVGITTGEIADTVDTPAAAELRAAAVAAAARASEYAASASALSGASRAVLLGAWPTLSPSVLEPPPGAVPVGAVVVAEESARTVRSLADVAEAEYEYARRCQDLVRAEAARGRAEEAVTEASTRVTEEIARLPSDGLGSSDPLLTRTTKLHLTIEAKALAVAGSLLPYGGPPSLAADSGTAWSALELSPEEDRQVRRTPHLAYTVACYLVRWEGVRFADGTVRELLDRATIIDVLMEFAMIDPELSTARDTDGFNELKARLSDKLANRQSLERAATRSEATD